jgi:hypothetical protein
MLPEDQNAFLRVVQQRDSTVVVVRDSDSAEIIPLASSGISPDKTLCLCDGRLFPRLKRKWIPGPGYYRIETLKTPILEFTPSFTATWEGMPGLGQGRLFGNFEPYLGKPPDFEKWYESLARWIRLNYQKNPASGGYLLPNILPPRTKEWLAEIGKQHARSRTPLRSSRRANARS